MKYDIIYNMIYDMIYMIQCCIVLNAKDAQCIGPPLLVVFMTLFQNKRRPPPCPR